jgi:hypothetical protein
LTPRLRGGREVFRPSLADSHNEEHSFSFVSQN